MACSWLQPRVRSSQGGSKHQGTVMDGMKRLAGGSGENSVERMIERSDDVWLHGETITRFKMQL